MNLKPIEIVPAMTIREQLCVMELFAGRGQRIRTDHYNEDDAMQHLDCLAWHREQHEELSDILPVRMDF